MRKIILIFLIFFSCLENKPDNLMSEKQMVDFLFDINIINSSRAYRNNSDLNYYNIKDTFLYRIHDIDSMQFVKSNDYYSKNPKLYLKIYNELQKKLIKIRDSIDLDLQNHTKKIKDSLMKSVN